MAVVIIVSSFWRPFQTAIGKRFLWLTAWMVLGLPFSVWRRESWGILTHQWWAAMLVFVAVAGLIADFGTGQDCLLEAVDTKGGDLWRYNADHLRRWAGEHRTRLRRLAEDQKYEQRPVPSFAQRREAAVRKFRARMDSAAHEIAAQLAAYAARRHFATVRYDDSDRSYLGDGFPWFRLRALVAEKLDARGIGLDAGTPGGAGNAGDACGGG